MTRVARYGVAVFSAAVALTLYIALRPAWGFSLGLLILALAGGAILLIARRKRSGPAAWFDRHFLRRSGLLGGVFVLLILLTRLLYLDFARQQAQEYRVTHTYEVLSQFQALDSALEQTETAQRGYLLTGDTRYLERFQSASRAAQSARASLAGLTTDHAAQRDRLNTLGQMIDERLSLLRRTVELRDTQGLAAAIAAIRADRGTSVMDECRILLHTGEQEERDLLQKRSLAAQAQALNMRWVLGLGSGSLLLLLAIAGMAIEWDVQQREQARQAVRRSEERLRLALDSANAGIWEWDLRTGKNLWSDELWKVYGLEPNSCTPSYEAWRQVLHPDDRSQAEKVVGEAARLGAELNVEFRVEGQDGRERWVLARAQPLRDARGRPEIFIGIALDITYRKRAEEALRERAENLRRFTETAPVAIAMFDREMRYIAASRRYREDYHLGDRDLTGRSHYEIFPEISEAWREVHRRCLAGAVERNSRESFVRADGGWQWIRWEIQPWRMAGGEIGGIVLFSEDITAQTRAEQALRQSEARLRLAQQAARIGTFERNIQTGISAWTPELETMYGLEPGSFPGRFEDWQNLVHPEDRPKAAREVERALETGKFLSQWRVIRPDGTLRWIAGRGSLLRDEAGQPLRLVGVHIDITEQKEAEEALRRAHEELLEAHRVAHMGSWYWDTGTCAITTSSEQMYEIFGVDPSEPFPGLAAQARMYTAESWKRLTDAVKHAAKNGTVFESDAEIVRGDGSRVWVTARGEAVRDGEGRIQGFRGTLQDVTHRKQAQDEILARNAILDAINRVFGEALAGETEEALGQACLSIAGELTGSRLGLIGEVNAAGRLEGIAVSHGDSASQAKLPASLEIHGIYGRVILDGKAFYTNELPSHPDAIGLPPGHPPLTAFLGAPLVHAGKVIGLIAVGNREGGYSPRELQALEALAPAVVQAFMRKRAEEAQRASEAQFRTLANAIPQLCWMARADGWIYWYNQRWYDYTGTVPAQMEGWGWKSVHDPAALPEVLDRWNASIRTGEPFDRVFPLRGADGKFRPFLTRVMPVRGADGQVVQWFGTNTDISERLGVEAALRESEHRFRQVFENAPMGIGIAQREGGLEQCNPALCNLLGYSEEELRGVPFLSLIPPEDRETRLAEINRMLSGEVSLVQNECRYLRKDGQQVWVHRFVSLMHGESGGPPRRLVLVNDITRRKHADMEIRRLNAQLEQRVNQRTAELQAANRELEAFSYSVSHDLRAPLRGIDGWSLALAEDYAGQLDARALQYLSRVRSETQRMGLLIDDMLQLSRISSSQMRSVRVDLSEIAQGIVAELQEAHAGRAFEFAIAPGLSTAGDPRLLRIALTNLFSNAVKFTGPRELARIEFGLNGEGAFYIRDNGVGFDMAYAGSLFRTFQRLHKTSEFPGTGIGLAIVQRVIHRHGGRVWTEARPNEGATFYFKIGTAT